MATAALIALVTLIRARSVAEEILQHVRDTFPPGTIDGWAGGISIGIAIATPDQRDLTSLLKADPRTRDTCIIALTAYAMKSDEARVRAAGCDGYLAKPIDTRTLSDVVASYLARTPAFGG